MTPLPYTAVNGYSTVVKPLFEKSAEVESEEEKHGVVLLLWAAMNGRPTAPAVFSVARSKQVCIEWMEATVLFRKDCLEGKGDLYRPASHLAFAGDALARLTRDALPALLG